MRVLSVGGGPAGLYFGLLAKRADPSRAITVLERNGPDDTFGFGVVFSDRTLQTLHDSDAETSAAIAEALVRWDTIHVRHRGRSLRSAGHGFAAIARKRLLQILRDRATEVGVDLRFHTEFDQRFDVADYDLVLAADGSNSRLRQERAAHFGTRSQLGAAKFIWFGTTKVFDSFYFAFEENEHGAFASHAYPYGPERSTFIVETNEGAWRAAGLDVHAAAAAPPGASDLHSRDYFEKLFAEHLGGHELLVNNSKWLNFPTIRNARWSDGNVVLLGDAAHTAHFSVGSGTKMALEDATALARALDAEPDVPAAIAAYERTRRPEVERIQDAAGPSLAWWEHFGEYMAAEPERFAFHFLTRNPRITRGNLQRRDGELVGEVERWFARRDGGSAGEPRLSPLSLRDLALPNRTVARVTRPNPTPAPEAEALANRVRAAAASGAGLVLLSGVPSAQADDGLWGDLAAVATLAGATLAVDLLVPAAGDPGGTGAGAAAAVAALAEAGVRVVLLCRDAPPWGTSGLPALLTDVRRAVGQRVVLGVRLDVPAPVNPATDDAPLAVLSLARSLVDGGCDLLALGDGRPEAGSDGAWRVLELGARVRLATGLAVLALDATADADEVNTAVLAGRADLCG